jgi:WD40 repeat protein/serine/threonine protein kinase
MSVATIADLLAAIRSHRLLDPARLAEAEGPLSRQCPDPRALARELVRRGWLTAYQADRLVRDDGGLTLGSYVLLDKLGEGGMGAVFRARHARLGRSVALKVIRKERLDSEAAVKRFRREIMAAAQLDHPNIVLAYDADESGGTHFFAMELVEGTDLAKLVKQRGPLPVREACEYVRQAALGLQHAFERGLVHRDVKPANLLLTTTGVVKVLDMGLARLDALRESESASTLTQEGTVMGTPDYMAPEQALRSHDVDIRADLYALGCTLFFLLTGRVPFAGGSATEKLLRRQVEAAPDVRSRRPDVPEAVAAVVAKLMATRPADRYQTPAELALALEDILRVRPVARTAAERTLPEGEVSPFADIDVPTGDTTATLSAAGPPRAARKPLVLAAVGGLVLAGVLTAVLWPGVGKPPAGEADTSAARQPTREESAAEAERKRRAEADEALGPLAEKAADSRTTFAEFAGDVAAFKVKYGGMPAAVRATELLMKLPSLLDQLDPKKLPEDCIDYWMALGQEPPKELVGVRGEHRRRHWGAITCLAVSPNGKLVATGGSDGVIRVWDAADLGERLSMRSGGGPILNVVFTPDSRRLLSDDGQKVFSIRDLDTGKQLHRFEGHASSVYGLAISPDGTKVVSGGEDKSVRLWDAATGKELGRFEGHTTEVYAVAFSPDRKHVLSAGVRPDSSIRIWDVETRKQVRSLEGYEDGFRHARYSADGRRVLTSTFNNVARLFDAETGKELRRLDQGAGVGPVQFLSEETRIVAAEMRGFICVWDSVKGGELRRFGVPALQAMDVIGGRQLVTGHDDGTVRLWDVETGKEVQPLDTTRNPGNWAFSPDARHAAFFIDKTLYLWDVASRREKRRLEGHAKPILSAAFAPDGKHLLSGCHGGELVLWDVDSGKKLSQATTRGQITSLSFAADGGRALIVTAGGVVLWDLEGGREMAAFPTGTPGFVHTVLLSPDGRRAVAGANDSTIHIWDVAGRGKVRSFSNVYWNPVLSPDGRTLAYRHNSDARQVQLWNVEKDAPAEPGTVGEGQYLRDLAFSPDGKTLAVTTDEAYVRLFDVASGKKLREWQMPGVTAVGYDGRNLSFAPDGRHLAVANANGTVYLLRLDKPPAPKP